MKSYIQFQRIVRFNTGIQFLSRFLYVMIYQFIVLLIALHPFWLLQRDYQYRSRWGGGGGGGGGFLDGRSGDKYCKLNNYRNMG